MQTAYDLKMVLLQILEDVFQDNTNVQATQQMGVQLSNTVKREGVFIIQNQNVEIFSKMMPLMVKAIKICDMLEQEPKYIEHPETEQRQLPPPIKSDEEILYECCDMFYQKKYSWVKMQDTIKESYLTYVTGKFKTKNEAAKWLGVGSTYLSKLTKKVE